MWWKSLEIECAFCECMVKSKEFTPATKCGRFPFGLLLRLYVYSVYMFVSCTDAMYIGPEWRQRLFPHDCPSLSVVSAPSSVEPL